VAWEGTGGKEMREYVERKENKKLESGGG